MTTPSIQFFATGVPDRPPGNGARAGGGLVLLASLGLPVPAGFVVPPGAEPVQAELERGVHWLEAGAGLVFGDSSRPLLLTVRPTGVFYVGARADFSPLAHSFMRRVLGIQPRARGLEPLAVAPDDPWEVLWRAVRVGLSWGEEVTIHVTVPDPARLPAAGGLAYARDPDTGERGLSGAYSETAFPPPPPAPPALPPSVGRTARTWSRSAPPPSSACDLAHAIGRVERIVGDRVEMPYILDGDRVVLLGWRPGWRSARASLAIAVDLADEGIVPEERALDLVSPAGLDLLFREALDPRERARARIEGRVLARGKPVGGGAAVGRLAVDPSVVERDLSEARGRSEPWILVAERLSTEAVGAIHAASGVVVARGDARSEGAVLAGGFGTPCVVDLPELGVDAEGIVAPRSDTRRLRTGEWISLDGETGELFAGKIAVAPSELMPSSGCPSCGRLSRAFHRILGWADGRRRLSVRANADFPEDVRLALALGADGIGLVRTEQRLSCERSRRPLAALLGAGKDGGGPLADALDEFAGAEEESLVAILQAADGRPVTVRLLDARAHEIFEPEDGVDPETNPMLGVRGSRLAVLMPSLYRTQAIALSRAIERVRDHGPAPEVEVLLPMIVSVEEFVRLAGSVREVLRVPVGVLIEVPRAALAAGRLARVADFLVFGTNDLTQFVLAASRDDSQGFLDRYVEEGLLPSDPFRTIDREGVGRLVEIAVRDARGARPDVRIGVCGEQAGDPESIAFFDEIGLDSVSCVPSRVPAARLAAAQAALRRSVIRGQ